MNKIKTFFNAPLTGLAFVILYVFFVAACTLDTMGCGTPSDAYFPDGEEDARPDTTAPDAGSDAQPEAGKDAQPKADAAHEDAAKPDVVPDVIESGPDAVSEDAQPEAAPDVLAEAEPDVAEAGEDAPAEAAPEPQPEPQLEAGSDAVSEDAQPEVGPDAPVDAPEEPPTGVCATQGHDGKVMVHPIVTLGSSAFLTVFGMLTYPPPGPTTPFEGWCWSQQGGQGEFDCFPMVSGNEAAATPGTKVTVQLGTTNGPSGPPNYYLCDFGVCPVTVVFCSGKTEACRYDHGQATGNVVYKEPGHNGKGELTCTLP